MRLTMPPSKEEIPGAYSCKTGILGRLRRGHREAAPLAGSGQAEAYLKGFDGDLYGKTVRLFPQKFLRPVMRFSSAEALQTQLREDAEKI